MSIVNWLFEKAEPVLAMACTKLGSLAKAQRSFYTDIDPYLTRFYLTKRSSNKRYGVYLHYFHRGDADFALHDHPWGWCCSVVLTNGLVEERWDSNSRTVKPRILRPGSISVSRVEEFHRVHLYNRDTGAWTLFFSGRRVKRERSLWWIGGLQEYIQPFNFTRSRARYARPN